CGPSAVALTSVTSGIRSPFEIVMIVLSLAGLFAGKIGHHPGRASASAWLYAGDCFPICALHTWRRMEPRRAFHPHFAGEKHVATAVAEKDHIVKDISLADYGRDEIAIAETELPGLMATHEEFGASQPDR